MLELRLKETPQVRYRTVWYSRVRVIDRGWLYIAWLCALWAAAELCCLYVSYRTVPYSAMASLRLVSNFNFTSTSSSLFFSSSLLSCSYTTHGCCWLILRCNGSRSSHFGRSIPHALCPSDSRQGSYPCPKCSPGNSQVKPRSRQRGT